jgi:hypothetical protein
MLNASASHHPAIILSGQAISPTTRRGHPSLQN